MTQQQPIAWIDGEPIYKTEPDDELTQTITIECPNCDGNKTEIDDNDPNGTKTCYYCDGKGWVSYDEHVAYREHDPNLM